MKSCVKKEKTSTETKIFKKIPFRWPKRQNLLKNNEHPTESCPLTHFQLKNCPKLRESKFEAKNKNEHKNKNFQKNAISEAETMEFGRKTMNL